MSDRLKYLIERLNNEPFNKNYNLFSFDSLSPEDLLQVLTDVLAEIDEKNKVDIRIEEPEETTIRLLTMLRVLKYSPGPDPVGFRQGLVQGDKTIVQPILEWLLKNLEDLKTRAYLAEYLVKLELPLEVLSDPGTAAIYEQYEVQLEEFKALHKECIELKNQSDSTQEMRNDIETMEKEKDIVHKKIDRIARKLEGVDNKEELLEAADAVRYERERSKDLEQRRQEQYQRMEELQQRAASLTHQLEHLRQRPPQSSSPKDLIKRLEEEIQMQEYITDEKLKKEVDNLKMQVEILSNVASSPPYTQQMIDDLHSELQELSEEVEEIGGMDEDGVEDKMAPYRQQAAVIAKKKEQLADQYSRAKLELDTLLQAIKLKEEREEEDERGPATEEELERFVRKVNIRSTVYKRKKAEVSGLVAESGVLARTLDILKTRLETAAARHALGAPPVDDAGSAQLTKEAIVERIAAVNTEVAAYKAKLSPILEELRNVREEYNRHLEEYSEKKRVYDTTAAKLESGLSKLQQRVKELKKDKESMESEMAETRAKSDILEVLLDRSQNDDTRLNSLRDKLTKRIAEREEENLALKQRNREAREFGVRTANQRELWKNLIMLLECKEECMEKQKEKEGKVTRDDVAETLVLN